jgi:hypothetical protein
VRHVATLTIIAALSACSACATVQRRVPSHSQIDACQAVESSSDADRLLRPCEYADALAVCIGLPESDRQRISERCKTELEK